MRNIHLIAIGGSAMHNFALELHELGYHITGSDDQIFNPSRSRLQEAGILPDEMGWFPEKITSSIDTIILGMHAKSDNPELLRAKELGIHVMSYPEFLYTQHKEKKRVVIGGSHGKTTTTSMILHVLNQHFSTNEIDYMVGAQLAGFERMVKIDPNAHTVILEGDEYLSSPIDLKSKFLWYKPQVAVLTGIAWDHINVFPTFESYLETFKLFILSIEPGGVLIYNSDDLILKNLVETTPHNIKIIPYTHHTYSIHDGITSLEVENESFPISFFGKHNLMNFNAAKYVLSELGLSDNTILKSIQSFPGADKRLSRIYAQGSHFVFRDFAHSPSKVEACVKAVIEQFNGFKVEVFLELHTYSSLNSDFLPHYKNALSGLLNPVLYFSKKALEIKRMPDLDIPFIKSAFNQSNLIVIKEANFLHEEVVSRWKNKKEKTVFLFMSSGNYGGLDLDEIVNN